jgi:hypothetical protein
MTFSKGLITSAAFGAALVFAGAVSAQQASGYRAANQNGSLGDDLSSIIMAPFVLVTAPFTAIGATAPLTTGRSVATSQPGNSCTTPVKTCELREASFVGNGCSCRVSGGRARGSVTP